jgi:hypothetical protein
MKQLEQLRGTISRRVVGVWSIWLIRLSGLSGFSVKTDKTDRRTKETDFDILRRAAGRSYHLYMGCASPLHLYR